MGSERDNGRERCLVTGKAKFPTKEAARAAVVDARLAREAGRAQRKEQRSYWCLSCGSWHLTSEPGRRKARDGRRG